MDSTVKHARKQGSINALKATFITQSSMLFIIASFFISATGSIKFLSGAFVEPGVINILSFVILSFIFSYLLGGVAGIAIMLNKRSYIMTGIIAGLFTVLLSTMSASFFSMAIQIVMGSLSEDWFILFVAKPLIWMLLLSIIPIVIAGSWLGNKLQEQKHILQH